MKHPIPHFLLLCIALPAVFCLCSSPENDRLVHQGPVHRIISLSPSISREIADLGRREVLIGVTSFDDFRDDGIEIVGTLIQPNLEAIIQLKPDIVLFSGEDGPVQNIDRLRGAGVRMHRFDRNRNFRDICDNYRRLALLLGRKQEADIKITHYSAMLGRIKARRFSGTRRKPLTVAFLLSHRPMIAASEESFIAQVIRDAGGACIYSGAAATYPLVSMESLVEADPDVIISMAGDDDANDFFRRLSRDYRNLKVVSKRAFYIIDPDTIPYYTPADYVKSVERVAEILNKAAGR